MTDNELIEKSLRDAGYPATIEVFGSVRVYCIDGPEKLRAIASEFGRSIYAGQTEGVYVL